jgi:hypothetical protein
MVDDSTSFLTIDSFQPGSIIVLVSSQAEQAKLLGKVAKLETKEQRASVRVAMRNDWYAEEGLAAPKERRS